jgi:hypothetical protein
MEFIMNTEKSFNLNRVALLYRDILSTNVHSLAESDKTLLLSLKPNSNKIVSIGDIDISNWNAYPLTYMLANKLVSPTVLDESKIYQSIQAMRTHNECIAHPQMLISQCVIIRIIGLDSSPNINDYINTFISMCIASEECKLIFVIFDCDKRTYKNSIYIRKTNSSFIDISSADKKPYTIDSTPLCISPDSVTFFNYSKKDKSSPVTNLSSNTVSKVKKSRSKNSCASLFDDPDMF